MIARGACGLSLIARSSDSTALSARAPGGKRNAKDIVRVGISRAGGNHLAANALGLGELARLIKLRRPSRWPLPG